MQASEIFDYASQPKERVDSCNLCGSLSFSLLSRSDRYGLPVWTNLCMGCGLGFISPRMTSAAYADFYAQGIYRELLKALRQGKPDGRDQYRKFYIESLRDLLRPHLESSMAKGWILDIGGAEGETSAAIRDAFGFYSNTVIDPSGESGSATNFEDYHATNGMSDLILICQTVDHLLDLRGSLEKVHRLLSQDGLLYIDVADFYQYALINKRARAAFKVDHPYYLTDRTMSLALESCGFRIIQRDYSMGYHVGFLCKKGAPAIQIGSIFNMAYAEKLLENLRAISPMGIQA